MVGWFQGRMEFGPRALGGRSILADPRDPKMRDTLNMKIKFREGFRPFAPSVLADKASEWFEIDCDSPYMLLVAQVREGKRVDPLGHPRGQLGPAPDRDPRREPPLLRPHRRVRAAHGRAHRHQHLLQRPRASPSSAPPTTPTCASCARTWTTWCWGTTCSTRRTSPRSARTSTGAPSSSWIDRARPVPFEDLWHSKDRGRKSASSASCGPS